MNLKGNQNIDFKNSEHKIKILKVFASLDIFLCV